MNQSTSKILRKKITAAINNENLNDLKEIVEKSNFDLSSFVNFYSF